VQDASSFFRQLRAAFSPRDWMLALALVAAIWVTYQPVWYAGFIWDDDRHITSPELRSLRGLGHIWLTLGATQQYYPLVHSVFWFEHRLWGNRPLPYHLVNVFLYSISTLLLFKILRQLEVPGAWFATAIFALHPVQVETVAWVTELKNVLSGLFYFGAALAYLEFDRTRARKPYDLAFVLFILGLISKSVIASLPAALLLVFWWKRGTLSWKKDVEPLISFFIVGIFGGLFTAYVEKHFIGAEGAAYNYTFIERGLIAGHALWFYLAKLAWPADLLFIYPRWVISPAIAWQYLFPAAVVVLAAVLIGLSRRWRGPLAGFLFFAGTLFPAIGFFNVYPFRYSFVADHFQYLASLGAIVPCAAGLTLLAERLLPGKQGLRAGLGVALLAVLGTLSWQRAWVYRDLVTLWQNTIAGNPDCFLAHNNLGADDVMRGKFDDALVQFQEAIRIDPSVAEVHNNIGLVYYRRQEFVESLDPFREALKLEPENAVMHYNLANSLFQLGQVTDAIAEYKEALVRRPGNISVTFNLAQAYLQIGQYDLALADFQYVVRLAPNYPEAQDKLARAEAAVAQRGR
jgi:tetratricopeptide (TPR) repeat protein